MVYQQVGRKLLILIPSPRKPLIPIEITLVPVLVRPDLGRGDQLSGRLPGCGRISRPGTLGTGPGRLETAGPGTRERISRERTRDRDQMRTGRGPDQLSGRPGVSSLVLVVSVLVSLVSISIGRRPGLLFCVLVSGRLVWLLVRPDIREQKKNATRETCYGLVLVASMLLSSWLKLS